MIDDNNGRKRLPPSPATILRLPQVEAMTGLKRSSLYAAIAEGRFPRQIQLGPRAVGWLASEIDAWIAARIADSRLHIPANVITQIGDGDRSEATLFGRDEERLFGVGFLGQFGFRFASRRTL
jgi:prophage regulatory protein